MRLVSTGGKAPPTDLRTAVFRGLAPDGGLYLPEGLARLSADVLDELRELDWPDLASRVMARLLTDALPEEEVRSITGNALDFPVPLVEVAPGRWCLELFHGPTLAFKDVGARFLARLMARYLEEDDPRSDVPVTVLVATSGDTGGAVARAFQGLSGLRVAVLYPEGRVSPVQERQFTTVGENVRAFRVKGSFDDCQGMVKEAFCTPGLRERHRLTSANSINVGRLLPQVAYYVHLLTRLPKGEKPVISVPSGNFGNLTAGLMALRMGAGPAHFVAATNANDVVPRYLETGRLEPQPSVRTLSTAMDVGDPSNFGRILHMYGHDRGALQKDLGAGAYDDGETRRCIGRVHREHGYTLDPHGAVGWLGMEAALARPLAGPGVTLATAHPAKFREVVEPSIDGQVSLPGRLARVLDGKASFQRLEPTARALGEALDRW